MLSFSIILQISEYLINLYFRTKYFIEVSQSYDKIINQRQQEKSGTNAVSIAEFTFSFR